MRLPSESFQILGGCWTLLPFPSALVSLCTPDAIRSHGLTSDVWKASSTFPTVWAGEGMSLVFIQAGLAVDPPTAGHLVRDTSHEKTDLTHQLIRWCLHKLAIVPTSHGKVGSHLNFLAWFPDPSGFRFRVGGASSLEIKTEEKSRVYSWILTQRASSYLFTLPN